MKHNYNSQKIALLKRSTAKLDQLLRSGVKTTDASVKSLIDQIRSLAYELRHMISTRQLKRILGSFAVILGAAFGNKLNAQTFAAPVTNPFNITTSGSLSYVDFADMDNDGDLDMMVGAYYGEFFYFENTGTAIAPDFTGAPLQNPFGLTPAANIAFPRVVDMDNDGDFDMLVGEYYGNFKYFQNTGTATNPAFAAPVQNAFGLTPTYYYAFPDVADMDNDGDFDIIAGEYYGAIKYYQNTGTAAAAAFGPSTLNPFGLTGVTQLAFPEAGDFDGDGDFDLMIGEYGGNVLYFENTGTAASPVFGTPATNPFGIVAGIYYSMPSSADLDDDGDTDLMVVDGYGVYRYYENTNINASINELNSPAVSVYPNPAVDVINLSTEVVIDQVRIIDLSGKVVLASENDVHSIDISSLESGSYVLEMHLASGHVKSEKISKK